MGWYINIIKAVKVKAEKPEKRSSEKIEATTYAENIVTALITEGPRQESKSPQKSDNEKTYNPFSATNPS